MAQHDHIQYRVNSDDELVFANEAWDSFADANADAALQRSSVLGQPLWQFISDLTTAHLYREILARARAGKALRFTLRCDSADCRRQLEMRVAADQTGAVEFNVRTLSETKRPPQALLDPRQPRSEELVLVCSWCKKFQLPDGWYEVEDAVARLGLFNRQQLPGLTHGMCDSCLTEVSAVLDGAAGEPTWGPT